MGARLVRLAALVVILGSALIALAFSTRFGSTPDVVDSPLIGRPAPSFELPLLDDPGSTFALAGLADRTVVVNFFASWCLECRKEHADLVATAEAFAARDVVFVQIAYDDTPADAAAFLDELGRSDRTVYLIDPGNRTAIAYGVFGVPETFFIDREGLVRAKIVGESNAVLLGGTLDQILAGSTPGLMPGGNQRTSP